MQRFYCTTCDQPKRVRQLPQNLQSVDLAETPIKMRQGECRFHTEQDKGTTRAQVNHRGKVRTPSISKKGLSAAQARSKSKKG